MRRGRPLALLAAACCVLVAGIAGSVAGGVWWDHYQRAAATTSTSDTAAAIGGTLAGLLAADVNFTAAVSSTIATSPGLTNRHLASWLSATKVPQRYPGTAGFSFVEPVSAARLPAFVSAVQADPPGGMAASPYAVYPPGARARYCLIRFGEQYRRSNLPIGIDLCSLTARRLDRVRRSGRSDLVTFASLLQGGVIPPAYARTLRRHFGGLFLLINPVYRPGAALGAPAARAGAFEGWTMGTFSARTLLQAGIEGTSGVHVSLRYRQGPGRWQSVGAAGTAPGPNLRSTEAIRTGSELDVRLEAVVTSAVSTNAFLDGLLVALAGSVVSVLLFGFLAYLAGSRRRALQLVGQRTRELRHQALHDPLTDLPNRALLFDRAQQMLLRARRDPTSVGALYIDLDNFKEINDTFGHQVGDQLLQAVATRLLAAVRASDTVGRLGGDEFLVLVQGESLEAGPELVADRLIAVLAEPFLLETPDKVLISVRASIGAAVGMRRSADELIRDADIALYAAKASGRGRVVVFQPEMQTAVEDRLALEIDLQRAVDDHELFVVYQPIVDLRTMTARSAEALVRWRHPTRGVLAPSLFIPLAEETGLVVPIGRFVLDRACRQAARWRAEGYDISVAVNLSARQLEHDTIVDDVRGALERHHLPPGTLTLELTETTVMAEPAVTVPILRRLRELGARISVDDFGTGYSSLSYLRTLPIDTLKIDRSFIAQLADRGTSRPVVHSIVALGKALGVEVLAEGIEDTSQLQFLQRQHCDSGQGYLFGRPVGPKELESRFLRPQVGPAGRDGRRGRPRVVTRAGPGRERAAGDQPGLRCERPAERVPDDDRKEP